MFAADAQLDAGARRSAAFGGQADQLPDAIDIKADKGIAGKHTLFDIGGQELAGIIAAESQRGLGTRSAIFIRPGLLTG